MARWHDIIGCSTAGEARALISEAAKNCRTPADTVEYIGGRMAREMCPDGGWNQPFPSKHADAWRKQLASRAFLRWQENRRQMLIEDVFRAAGKTLEEHARKAGVSLLYGGRESIESYVKYGRGL